MNVKTKVRLITLFACAIVLIVLVSAAIQLLSVYGGAIFSMPTVKEAKARAYARANRTCEKGRVVFLGDSITEMYRLNDYYYGIPTYNRGIGGDITSHMASRLESNALVIEPSALVLLGGVNDLRAGISPEEIAQHMRAMIEQTQQRNPDCAIVLISVYPVNPQVDFIEGKNIVKLKDNQSVEALNELLRELAREKSVAYADVYPYLLDDAQSVLKEEYTLDGLHLTAQGYAAATRVVLPILEGALAERASAASFESEWIEPALERFADCRSAYFAAA